MERIFWVECPDCKTRWCADWELRHSEHKMECPKCTKKFKAEEASWLDERERR